MYIFLPTFYNYHFDLSDRIEDVDEGGAPIHLYSIGSVFLVLRFQAKELYDGCSIGGLNDSKSAMHYILYSLYKGEN